MVHRDNFVVVIKCDGNILREKNGYVYLPFGSQYSILLKNLDSRKAVVSIHIDGKKVTGDRRIIVNPNDSVELEGFKEESEVRNKFKFIKKTKEIIEHRGDRIDDGIIRVEINFEEKVHEVVTTYWWPGYTYRISDNRLSYTSAGIGNYVENADVLYCNSGDIINNSISCSSENKLLPEPNQDEGITVKGSDTNQKFVPGYVRKLEEESHVIIIRLKGINEIKEEVIEPITTKLRLDCPTCNRRSKSNSIFCYNCGTRLV